MRILWDEWKEFESEPNSAPKACFGSFRSRPSNEEPGSEEYEEYEEREDPGLEEEGSIRSTSRSSLSSSPLAPSSSSSPPTMPAWASLARRR